MRPDSKAVTALLMAAEACVQQAYCSCTDLTWTEYTYAIARCRPQKATDLLCTLQIQAAALCTDMQSAMSCPELDNVVATHSSKAQDTAEQAGVWQLDEGSCEQLSGHAAQPCPAHLSCDIPGES